jgi:hypothetical protein
MASTIITKNKASGAPSSLAAGELAVNTNDGSFYYGSTGGTSVSSSFTFGALTASVVSASGNVEGGSLRADDLTAGRVAFIGTDGLLVDDSDLTFATATLTATNISLNGGTLNIPFGASLDARYCADVKFLDNAISGDKVEGGTINATTITTLTTAAINASTDIDIGSHNLKAETLTSDVTTGTAPLTVTSTTEVSNLKAATATLAATATAVTITDNENTDEENVITFVAGAAGSGNVGLEADGNLTYNPSTGKVTATGFVGGVTGNADTSTKIANIDNANIVVLAGAQTLTGTKTLNSFKGTGGATVTNILDEDAMGSNSATSLATQQSIKAYTDNTHATVQTGKNYRIVNASFRDDIATDKHYVPMKSVDENDTLTRAEQVAELAVCDGRLVSATVRLENMQTEIGAFNLTMGVETNVINASYTGFSVIETEVLEVTDTNDDHHVFHFVFDTSKHWDSTDMFAISIESSGDAWETNERFFVTLVIEDDWSTYLAGASREIDSTPT